MLRIACRRQLASAVGRQLKGDARGESLTERGTRSSCLRLLMYLEVVISGASISGGVGPRGECRRRGWWRLRQRRRCKRRCKRRRRRRRWSATEQAALGLAGLEIMAACLIEIARSDATRIRAEDVAKVCMVLEVADRSCIAPTHATSRWRCERWRRERRVGRG